MVRISDEEWSRDVTKKEKKKLDNILTTLPRRKNHELHLGFSLTRRILHTMGSKPHFYGFIFICGKGEENPISQAPLNGLISLLNNAAHPGGFVMKQLLNVLISLLKQSTFLPSLLYVSSGRLLRALTPFAVYLKIPLVQRLSDLMIDIQERLNRVETEKSAYVYTTSGYLDVPHIDLDLFTLFVHMSNKFTISKCQHLLNSGNVFEIELPAPLHQSAATTKLESSGFTQPGVVYVRVLGASGHCLPSINICFDIRDNILTPETTKYGTFSEYGELHFCSEPLMEPDDESAGLSEVDLQYMLEYGIFVSQWNPDLFSIVKRVDSLTGQVHITKRFPTAREMMITCYVLHTISELARTQGHLDPKTGNLTRNVDVENTILHQQIGRNDPNVPCHSRPTELYYLPINQRYANPTTCLNVTTDSILTPPVPWLGEGTRSWTDEDTFPTIKGIPPIDSSFVEILQNLKKRIGDVWKDTEAASMATINATFPNKKKKWKATKKLASESHQKHPELCHGDHAYGCGRSCFNIQETDWKGLHPTTGKKYKKNMFPNGGGGYFQNNIVNVHGGRSYLYENNRRISEKYEDYEISEKERPIVGASEFASPQVQAAAKNQFVAVDGKSKKERTICHWCAKFAWQISREDSTFQGMTKCKGCRSAYYCGKKCQTAHWKCKSIHIHGQADRMEGLPHKRMCKKLKQIRLLVEKQIKDPQQAQKGLDIEQEKDQITARILHSAPHLHLEARCHGGAGSNTMSEENSLVCAFVRAYEQGDAYVVDPQNSLLETKKKCYLEYVKDLEKLLRDVSNPRIERQSKAAAANTSQSSKQGPHGKYPYVCKGGRRVGGGGKVFYGGDTWMINNKTVAYLCELSDQCSLYDETSMFYLIPFWVGNEQWDCDLIGLATHMLKSKKKEICVLGNNPYLPWHLANRKKTLFYPQFERFPYGWIWDVREPKPLRTFMTSMWSPVQLVGLKKEGYNGCIGRRGRFDPERNRVFVGLVDGRECWVRVNNILPYNPLEMMPGRFDHPAQGTPGKYSERQVAAVEQAAVLSVVQRHADLFGCCPSNAASPLLMDFFKQLTEIATEVFMLSKDKYAELFSTMNRSTFVAFMAPFDNGVYLAEQNLTRQVETRQLLSHHTNTSDATKSRDYILAHFCTIMPHWLPADYEYRTLK